MSTKTAKAKPGKPGFRYAKENLAPRDLAADEAFGDAYIKRNKDALNASIVKARAEIARGEFFTQDQVMADLKAQRLRRRTGKK
jgi:predicted transcriptional regulator